jgi:hypothetical protein
MLDSYITHSIYEYIERFFLYGEKRRKEKFIKLNEREKIECVGKNPEKEKIFWW